MKIRSLASVVLLAVTVLVFWAASMCGESMILAQARSEKPAQAAGKEAGDKSSIWMEMKLKYTEQILGGLTHGDFGAIRESAAAMALTGYLEKWFRAEDRAYKRQVALFEMANAELIRQADAKNLEGATLAFNQLTVSCVQCHKIVRDVKKK
jgi:hypothetical protein